MVPEPLVNSLGNETKFSITTTPPPNTHGHTALADKKEESLSASHLAV